MKSFRSFRLDVTNQCLWKGEERVPIAPKAYDVLRYLVGNPGRLVTQEELLDALWAETHVNPELVRKYILDIRKILGDRPDKPEFIETVTKRGYRFIAPVVEEGFAEVPGTTASLARKPVPEVAVRRESTQSKQDRSPAKRRLTWKLALIPVLAMVAAAGIAREFRSAHLARNATPASATSIAVLPFADLSSARDQEYFSDGLSEQLIHELAQVSGLKVVGRSSAFEFKGKNEDLRTVGRKLGAANVLEGSVRRQGNHVRINAELIKTEDGFQLWSETYDREINDIFSVQDEIARATTRALQLKLLGSNGQPVPATLRSANPGTYQAYLQANYFWGRGAGKEDLDEALAHADEAIKLDDKYAPAWALRASVENMRAEVGLTNVT